MRTKGNRLVRSLELADIRSKISNSWTAVRSTYFSTKETFEKHKVAFTVGTSCASVATAWAGYTLRHYHQSKIERRLESIENAIETNTQLERSELRKLVDSGSSRTAVWCAVAATTFVMGYALGWRGGRWYTNRMHRKEQKKLLGQMKPRRWQMLGKFKGRMVLPPSLSSPLSLPKLQEISGAPSRKDLI